MLRLVLPKGSLEKATLDALRRRRPRRRAGLGRRLPGHASTTPASTRSASCGPRRSRATWPRAASTSASPVATGSRRPGPRWSRWASSPIRRPPPTPSGWSWRWPRTRRSAPSPIWPPGRGSLRSLAAPSTPSSPAGCSRSTGSHAEIRMSYGATEAKIPDIADAVVEITETGRALARGRAARSSRRCSCRAPSSSPTRRRRPTPTSASPWSQLLTLAAGHARGPGQGAAQAQRGDRQARIGRGGPARPCKSPTVSELSGDAGFAVETVVPKTEVNVLIPALKDRGATDIIEIAAVEDRALRCPIADRAGRAAPRAPWFGVGRRVRRAPGPRCGARGRRRRLSRSTAPRSPTAPGRIEVGTSVVFVVAAGQRWAATRPGRSRRSVPADAV